MPRGEPGPWIREATLYWNAGGQRNHVREKQMGVGVGGVFAFKQAIALVTTRTVRTPFFLGAREKGYHGNPSNPRAWVLVITDALI